MGLFDLFKKWPEPLKQFDDEVLGPMIWSDDDEAWRGKFGGTEYTIGYGREPVPTAESLAYAREIMIDPDWLKSVFQGAKAVAIAEYPAYAAEIGDLRIQAIHFYTHKKARRILADLGEGQRDRSWRMEFLKKIARG